MKNAIKQAKLTEKEIPVGCVIKKGTKIIAQSHNMREENCDITAHAEILAIKEAQKVLKTTRLKDCDIYVTLEPCPMCAWAILQAGFKSLYFGAYNLQYGGICSVLNMRKLANSKIKVYGGIMEEECNKLLDDFFRKIRNNEGFDNE